MLHTVSCIYTIIIIIILCFFFNESVAIAWGQTINSQYYQKCTLEPQQQELEQSDMKMLAMNTLKVVMKF